MSAKLDFSVVDDDELKRQTSMNNELFESFDSLIGLSNEGRARLASVVSIP